MIREKTLGPDLPYVRMAGVPRYAEAQPLFKRTISIEEEPLGLEHPVAENLDADVPGRSGPRSAQRTIGNTDTKSRDLSCE